MDDHREYSWWADKNPTLSQIQIQINEADYIGFQMLDKMFTAQITKIYRKNAHTHSHSQSHS